MNICASAPGVLTSEAKRDVLCDFTVSDTSFIFFFLLFSLLLVFKNSQRPLDDGRKRGRGARAVEPRDERK